MRTLTSSRGALSARQQRASQVLEAAATARVPRGAEAHPGSVATAATAVTAGAHCVVPTAREVPATTAVSTTGREGAHPRLPVLPSPRDSAGLP
jgi:hypothetical protein